ncbi:tyrS: tyrosine--tRNA ligase [Raineya orbicola]|jgi:tyrosyl-tRNA synthetase|uniref:Tyrosine--tRNA ligase n=2 Tax=Raineya orbicola TaxID=2016530 RepID=A0A2N3ICK0_9BACT|nr:tyrS: tyrosine--tRNA ligase [Raineya orbicola]
MRMNFIEELRWRGMLHDYMPDTEKLLENPTAGYIGFDPTASSLHIGNLATIMLLVHFQRAGHKPFALVGGATGMIGDPSGKSEERKFLDEETLQKNQEGIRKQLQKFLDFQGSNAAEMVNNYDWFKEMGFLEFLRKVGKHITVNYMMAKDSVKNRLGEGGGISFTEFSYQLLQGFDFYWLYKHKNVKLQMGGSDQWGNITTGTELIRRIEGGEAYALTTPLLTKADGSKFGKSESGNVWLDASMTSPYKFYQFFINQADADMPRLIRVFSLKTQNEIEILENEHSQSPEKRILQKALAQELTERIHSSHDLQNAIRASNILFGKDAVEDLKKLDEKTLLEVFEGVPQVKISKDKRSECKNVVDFLAEAGVFSSKGETRKAIQNNAVSINKIKITSPEATPTDFELLQGKYILAQKGKTNYVLIQVV